MRSGPRALCVGTAVLLVAGLTSCTEAAEESRDPVTPSTVSGSVRLGVPRAVHRATVLADGRVARVKHAAAPSRG